MTSLVHSTKFVLRPSGCRSVSPGSSGLRVGAIPMQVFIFGGNLDRLPIRFDFNIYCRGRSVWLRAQCVSTCFSVAGSGDLSEETQADKCCRASAAVRIQAHLFRTRQFLRLLRSYCLGYGQVTLRRSSEACLWYTTTDSKRISGSVVVSDESPALAAVFSWLPWSGLQGQFQLSAQLCHFMPGLDCHANFAAHCIVVIFDTMRQAPGTPVTSWRL